MYFHRKNLVKEKKKKSWFFKWVSIAFPVHSPPVLSCSVFQGARTQPCPLLGWHWGLWRNNSKLPYILVQESYAYFFIYSFQYSTFARALSFQKNEIRSLGPFITCEPANVPSVVRRAENRRLSANMRTFQGFCWHVRIKVRTKGPGGLRTRRKHYLRTRSQWKAFSKI